jgi:hypothetical protein
MESEVFKASLSMPLPLTLWIQIATMQYIAKYISVPLPAIYTWNSDASNPVGAEYMIMQKVIYLLFSPSSSFLTRFKVVGCPALDVWDDLSL